MIDKYCYYDCGGVCALNLSDSFKENVSLCVCEQCKEFISDECFDQDDERVIEYKS